MKDFAVFMRYPDPHALMVTFDSTFGTTPASAEYKDIESKLGVASEESDAAKRLELYINLENYILQEALALPMFWRLNGYSFRVQPWVRDLSPPKYYGSMLKNVWFDQEYSPE
jgi:ABC-type transport system substrate-binding protein